MAAPLRNRVSRRAPGTSKSEPARDSAQLLLMARRGMMANADFMNLVREQADAHRRAASASTLPRVRDHLSALAESLEAMLAPHKP